MKTNELELAGRLVWRTRDAGWEIEGEEGEKEEAAP